MSYDSSKFLLQNRSRRSELVLLLLLLRRLVRSSPGDVGGTFTTIVTSPSRLHRAQCAIKQTQVTVQKIGREIEEKLRCTSTSNELVRFDYFKPYPAGLLKHLAAPCWP